LILLLAIALSCAGGSPKGPEPEAGPETTAIPATPAPPETVALVFAWPADLVATVDATWRRSQSLNGQAAAPAEASARYTLRTEPVPEGLRVVSERFEFPEPLSPLATTVDAGVASIGGPSLPVSLLSPTLVVDAQGEVLRVEDVERVAEFWRHALAGAAPASPGGAARAESLSAMLFSERALTQRASQSWNQIVRAWAGTSLELGVEYEVSDPANAEGGAASVPTRRHHSAAERVPCRPDLGDTDLRCVRLELVAEVDPEALARASSQRLRALMEKAAPGEVIPDDMFRRFENVQRVTVITEPDTLRPHRAVLREEKRADFQLPGQGPQTLERVVETEYRFSY
jgi:hypothetical protein